MHLKLESLSSGSLTWIYVASHQVQFGEPGICVSTYTHVQHIQLSMGISANAFKVLAVQPAYQVQNLKQSPRSPEQIRITISLKLNLAPELLPVPLKCHVNINYSAQSSLPRASKGSP